MLKVAMFYTKKKLTSNAAYVLACLLLVLELPKHTNYKITEIRLFSQVKFHICENKIIIVIKKVVTSVNLIRNKALSLY